MDDLTRIIGTTRKTFKISGDISFSDMQQLIREHMNMPEFILTESQYSGIRKLSKEKDEMLKIMGFHYSSLSQKKSKKDKAKLDELLTMARFLQKSSLHSNYEIEAVREAPDFILKNTKDSNERVAVELTEILEETIQRETNDFKKVLFKATVILAERVPLATGIINLQIIPVKFTHQGKSLQKLNRFSKETAPEIIASFVQNWLENQTIEKPEFIKHISYSKTGSLSIELSEAYVVHDLASEKIRKAVNEKESKLRDYLAATGLRNGWLILVLKGSGQAAGYKLDNITLSTTSSFERIYLFESFGGVVVRLQ